MSATETIPAGPSLIRKLTKNKVGRPRFSILLGTVINSPQLKRESSGESQTSAYTTASEATNTSTSVLESVDSAATSPPVTPALDPNTAEICPTCKARALSSDSVPVIDKMKDVTPSTSPRPQPAQPLASNPPTGSREADQDRITPVTSPTQQNSGAASPESNAATAGTSPDINYKANKKHQRPKLQRNLSSLWKILDPPELRDKTGVLHNLAAQDTLAESKTKRHGRNTESVDSITLNETMGYRK